MGDIPKDIVSILTQLLPGFVAAWVAYGLTSYAKPPQFERVIQALVYSFLVGALVAIEERSLIHLGGYVKWGTWDQQTEVIASAVSALTLGLVLAYFAHTDQFYRLARKLKITSRTAYPSEWYGAFCEHPRYVVLHLEGSRRIMGYPRDWPSDPAAGHFKLFYAAWLSDDGSRIPLENDHSILIPSKQVEFVEFLKYEQELSQHGSEAAEPTTASTSGFAST
jgi:hypothetical protein